MLFFFKLVIYYIQCEFIYIYLHTIYICIIMEKCLKASAYI